MNDAIRYQITPHDLSSHLYRIRLTLAEPDPAGQDFTLPVWLPGSYMIRDMARHVVSLAATCNGVPLACEKIDKTTWRCAPCAETIELVYEVYAWDAAMREAWLDESRGFFEGSSLFLLPLGKERAPCELVIDPPVAPEHPPAHADLAKWRVATSLPRSAAPRWGFGAYRAANYADLIDHPVEMGLFTNTEFEAAGVPCHLCVTGRHRGDVARIARDLAKVCATEIAFWGTAAAGEYWFILRAANEGEGGMEHRDSATVLVPRDYFPAAHDTKVSDNYRRLLGLLAHEYFHQWFGTRIRMETLRCADLSGEVHTRTLWVLEGATTYYQERMLLRAGVLDVPGYLSLLSLYIGLNVANTGRRRQTLAESSFDAWTKFYRSNENSPNAGVNYYLRGCIVMLALDLMIRAASGGRQSLDDVMRALWAAYGKGGAGMPEDGFEVMAQKVSGLDLRQFFADVVDGHAEPDLPALFKALAIDMQFRAPGAAPAARVEPALGARVSAAGDAAVSFVHSDGPARRAGIAPGDVLIAVNGMRVAAAKFDAVIKSFAVGDTVEITAFRRDELLVFRVVLEAQPASQCVLTLQDGTPEAIALRDGWLKQDL